MVVSKGCLALLVSLFNFVSQFLFLDSGCLNIDFYRKTAINDRDEDIFCASLFVFGLCSNNLLGFHYYHQGNQLLMFA